MEQHNHYKLNDSEEIIGSSDNASIVFDRGGFLLTNQRIIKVDRSSLGGATNIHSINLENIDSVQTTAGKPYQYLLLAPASFALLNIDGMPGAVPIICFIMCIAFFFIGRSKVIQLSSSNGAMILNVRSMAHDQIQDLVFEVEQAKQSRLESLQSKSSSSSPSSVKTSAEQRLKELGSLFENNLISQDEHDRKRESILNEI